MTKSSAD